MKTVEDITADMIEIVEQAKAKGKKKRPSLKKYVEFKKVVSTQTEEKVIFERKKLIDELKKINNLFPEYLKNFTAFRLKHDKQHEEAVKKEFNRVFEVLKLKAKIKDLNYLLNK